MGKIRNIVVSTAFVGLSAVSLQACGVKSVKPEGNNIRIETEDGPTYLLDGELIKAADIQQEGTLVRIAKKQVTTETTSNTTAYEQKTTGVSTNITTTQTTKKTETVTRTTPEPRLTIPAKYTTTFEQETTTYTTTVPVQEPAAQDMLIEPEIIPKEVEETISYENYNVIQGKEYKVISDKNTVSGSGEGLFSVQYNNYGVYSDALKEKIKEMNTLKEDFVVEQQEPLILPTVVLYRGKSADEIQMETGVAKEEIIRLNGIEKSNIERNFIIAILEPKQNEFTDMYGQNRIIYKDMVIIADRIVEHENNSALVLHEERDEAHNTVEYMVFNGKNVKTTVIARDAAHISQYGIQCHNKLSQETFGISKKPNNLITQVCNVPGFNVFSNGVNIVVSKKTPDQMKAGYEVINTLGGKQLTK